MHESSEKILDNPNSPDAKLRRKRKHQLRLLLLVLDYIVESLGSIVIFVVVFVANKSILQQHALTTFGSFVYGVPIPFSYLLSETRIRVIIIEHGWLQGIKAIFISSGGIKQSKIDKIVECAHNDKQLINKYFNVSKKNTTKNKKKCLSFSDFESISKDDHIFQVHYNAKKDEIKNKLISKSASYNRAINPSLSECNDISYNAQHQPVDEIDLKPKDTAIYKSSSYQRAIYPSTSKCSDISDNSQCQNGDETELKIDRAEIPNSASYYRAIHPSRTSEDSDISISNPANHLDLTTLVVSNVRLDADVVISMEPEIRTFENPMQPDIDIGKNSKVNRKSVCSPPIINNENVDTIKVLSSVDFQYDSIDKITVIDIDSDIGGTNPLPSVVCSNDSLDAITVIGVDSYVEGIGQLSSVGCRNDSIESIFRECVDSDVQMIERLANPDRELFSRMHLVSDEKSFQIFSSVKT